MEVAEKEEGFGERSSCHSLPSRILPGTCSEAARCGRGVRVVEASDMSCVRAFLLLILSANMVCTSSSHIEDKSLNPESFYIGTDHYRNVLHQQLNPSSRSISTWRKIHQGVCGLNAVMEKLMFFVSSPNMKRTVRMPSGLNHLPWVVQGARSMFRRVLGVIM